MILLVYTILCIVVAIFGFIYCAFTISGKDTRKEEEKNDEENNFITNNDIDNDFWNNY